MLIGKQALEEIAMDFVGELLELEAYNAILIITDSVTNVQIYILAKPTWTEEHLADAYLNMIWRLYALPRHMTSDSSLQFASKFL